MIYQLLFWLKDFFRTRQFGALRSSNCLKAMREYKKLHPLCEISGRKDKIEPHHKKSVSKHPELSADPTNFISLTRELHFWIGHNGSWSSENPDIEMDALKLKLKIQNRI